MTGFMDNWEKKDTTEAKEVNPPAEGGKPEPLAKQIFVQEGEYDPNLSIEEQELRDIEAAGGDGYSGEGSSPAEFPVKEEKKVTKKNGILVKKQKMTKNGLQVKMIQTTKALVHPHVHVNIVTQKTQLIGGIIKKDNMFTCHRMMISNKMKTVTTV